MITHSVFNMLHNAILVNICLSLEPRRLKVPSYSMDCLN